MKVQASFFRLPFLQRWAPGNLSSIGLDIGVSSVKAVRLARTGEHLTLLQQGVVPIAADALSQKRAQAIREALQLVGAERNPLFTGVAGPGAVLRLISIPKMTSEELKTALTFESEKHIPFRMDEVFLDSVILGELPGGRMEVILAAARKDLVNGRLELLSSAGVVPKGVDLEAVALANAWQLSPPASASASAGGQGSASAEPCGLVHLGGRGTILVFLAGGKLQFTREIPLGGEAFTQAIASALQVGADEAERIKCDPGERLAAVRSAVQPVWEEWLSSCRASLDFYENQFGRKVGRLFLSGGSARLDGFKEWLQEAAGLPVEAWDPLAGVESRLDPEQAADFGSRLGVAIGLAAPILVS